MSTQAEGKIMTLMNPFRMTVLLAAAIALVGCATTAAGEKKDNASGPDGEAVAENIRQKQAGNEKLTEFDLNKDKKTDVWTYTITVKNAEGKDCLLYTSPSPRDRTRSRMPSSA